MAGTELIPVSEYRKIVKAKPHVPAKKGNGSKAKAEMELVLKLMGVKYEPEYRFHPSRKWRFDWAIPEKRIGIEFEGIMSDKSRHTTVNGYTKDSEKYNAASKLGWVVLRYTVISYKKMTKDLIELLPSAQAMYCSNCGKLLIKQDCACPKCGSLRSVIFCNRILVTEVEGGGLCKRTHKPERGKATAFTCGKRLLGEVAEASIKEKP